MLRITLDIETTGAGSFMDPRELEMSLIGIHNSETDGYSAYTVPELPQLWPVLEKADLLVGYNSDHFDIPILNKYYAGDLSKIPSVDLLSEIKNALGRRLKLDSVAKATLGRGKSGDGLDAVKWWAEGKIELVKKYCLDDVKLTKELYEYALKNSSVKYSDFGDIRTIPLVTSRWEKRSTTSLTQSLPF
jgi:DEAD/DEAH box helicase domain-containing protein